MDNRSARPLFEFPRCRISAGAEALAAMMSDCVAVRAAHTAKLDSHPSSSKAVVTPANPGGTVIDNNRPPATSLRMRRGST